MVLDQNKEPFQKFTVTNLLAFKNTAHPVAEIPDFLKGADLNGITPYRLTAMKRLPFGKPPQQVSAERRENMKPHKSLLYKLLSLLSILLFTATACAFTPTPSPGSRNPSAPAKQAEINPQLQADLQGALNNSLVGCYFRRADTVDGGTIPIWFFIFQEDGQYYGYLNMDGFERDGEWAYTYPQARMLTRLRAKHNTIQVFCEENLIPKDQEAYWGTYEKGDLLFSLNKTEDSLQLLQEPFLRREAETQKPFLSMDYCSSVSLTDQEDREWYMRARGFWNQSAFYQYEDEFSSLEVYYDETNLTGIGLYHAVAYSGYEYTTGFDIYECETAVWQDKRLSVIKDGYDTPSYLKEYQEYWEYNDRNQPVRFTSTGLIEGWADSPYTDEIVRVEFYYREDGTLERKYSYYNDRCFDTYRMTEDTYYDEAERPVYTSAYVTHGFEEDYYIYTEDGTTPSYRLTVDHMGQDACALSFVKYE